jgi:hypothetical protein
VSIAVEEANAMSRFAKFFLGGVLTLATIAPIASARPPVVVVRGGFGGFYGPAFYGPGWGWNGPGFYGPYAYGYAPNSGMGSIKIESKAKSASVYVDGGFAGTIGDLRTFHLKPGSHDIELRAPDGNTFYQERVNVIAGKTLKLTPEN